MTSTHETCRERIAPASATASIMTTSDGRTAAETGCVTAFDATKVAAPVAMTRTDRRSSSSCWFELVIGEAIKSFLPRRGCRIDFQNAPADGTNAAFKITGLRQVPLTA